jgi:5-methylcytosine-specific restriction endonuclease McrA
MSKAAIPSSLRAATIEQAEKRCEYCQQPDDRELNVYSHEVDHVTARKHGGETEAGNLAYACFTCNRHKGTDLASIDPHTGKVTQLFNPRTQRWRRHFQLCADGVILPRTAVGRATVALLRVNTPVRVQIRAALIVANKMHL